MKKRILLILLTLLVLLIPTISYYNSLLDIFEQERQSLNSVANPDNAETEYTELFDFEGKPVTDLHITETENIQLNARAAVLIDGKSDRVLYEKNGYDQMAMASTTKIMTCIIALENGDLDDIVTVSKYASTMPDVQLRIREGEQYILRDLLYSLMLESHNDTAVAIAEHIGGSAEGFASMMNQKAKELGCKDTNFVTPNGLDAEEHYTTAVEIAIIASYAIKNQEFVKIINAPNWTFQELTTKRDFMVSNKDKFLYMYDGAIGVKTGFTNNAGYCFVGAASKDGKTFISSVLGSGWPPHKNYKWGDTIKLMDHGRDNFEERDIFYRNKQFDPVYVEGGKEKTVELYCEGEIVHLISSDEVVKVVYKVPEKLAAPVDRGMVVGNAIYYIGNTLIDEIPILTAASVQEIDFEYCIDKIMGLWLNEDILQ